MLNKLNFSDTAVACFPVRNVLDSFEIRLLLYISPIGGFHVTSIAAMPVDGKQKIAH